MRFATEADGLRHIKGKEIRDVSYIKNPSMKKLMSDSEEECRVDFEKWIWIKRFMFAPKELQGLLGKDHREKPGDKIEDVRNHHVNTFIDWAEERPRRRAIIIIDANQHGAATQIAKQISILGGDNTFGGLGLSETGEEPATHFWCNWNCSASEYNFLEEQKKLWWRVYDGVSYDTKEKMDELLALLSLKRIESEKIGIIKRIITWTGNLFKKSKPV